MLIKEESYQNNLEKSYTERKTKHERSGYSLSLTCSFDATKNRHYLYRGKDWAENFCKRSKELGTEIINYEEKEMIHKQIKKIKFCKRQKVCHICKNKIKKKKKIFTNENNENEFKQKKRSEIIAVTPENLEELLIIFAI